MQRTDTVNDCRTSDRSTSALSEQWLQRLLVVMEPAAGVHSVMEKAARLVATHNTVVDLFVCDVDVGLPDNWAGGRRSQEYRELLRERRRYEIEASASELQACGARLSITYAWEHAPTGGLIAHAQRSLPSLIVKGSRRRMAQRDPLASGDLRLLRETTAPVLFVGDSIWRSRPVIFVAADLWHPGGAPASSDVALNSQVVSFAGSVSAHLELMPSRGAPQRNRRASAMASARAPQSVVALVDESRPDIVAVGATDEDPLFLSALEILGHVMCDVLTVKRAVSPPARSVMAQ
jgi:hypothetical protein